MSSDARARLHLGSGEKYMPGAVNVDLTAATRPDVVHDLNVRPWPFATSSFDEVHAYDVIEHLDDVLKTIEEMHRVARPRALLNVVVPHFSSDDAFTDPTHRHYFGARTFEAQGEPAPGPAGHAQQRTAAMSECDFRPALTPYVTSVHLPGSKARPRSNGRQLFGPNPPRVLLDSFAPRSLITAQ